MARRPDDKFARTLKKRAGAHGRSVEAERRAALPAAFARLLASMPNVGLDADFERVDSAGGFPRVKARR